MKLKFLDHSFLRRALLLIVWLIPSAQATVVRLDIAVGGNNAVQEVYVELFDTQTPVTVDNFLNYVESANGDMRYDGTFVHRSVTGSIIQGGGYIYDPASGPFDASVPHIITDAPIANEFDPSRSNLRGTIAMAKFAGDPDSATSEWFINLTDNSANLDSQNGGFTVFGQVLDQDMAVIDSIAALSTENLGGAFQTLPTARETTGTPPELSDLVVVQHIEINATARARSIENNFDFGFVLPGTVSTPQTLTIQNAGGTDLVIDSIGNPFIGNSPFVIVRDECTTAPLQQAASCEVDLQFQPGSEGSINQSFFIISNDTTSADEPIRLSGFGAFDNPTLVVDSTNPVDFGNTALGAASPRRSITIRNSGNGELLPTATSVSGTNGTELTLTDNCSGNSLQLGESCTIDIDLSTATAGTKTAAITVTADPGAQQAQINVTGNILPTQPVLILPDQIDIDFGDFFYLDGADTTLVIENGGASPLLINQAQLSGVDASDFSLTLDTCSQITIEQGRCTQSITATAVTPGPKTAILEIQTNDPDNPIVSIILRATASQDRDGIPDNEEQAAPRSGDGNGDGTPDATQNNVTSLRNANGDYVTLESAPGSSLSNIAATSNPAVATTPVVNGSALAFPQGFFSFFIEGIPAGSSTMLDIYLHNADKPLDSYFKYNPISNSWLTFTYDPRTQTGAEINGNRITLHFVDGGRGDADNLANGRIIDPGGPATLPSSSQSSSSGGGCTLALKNDDNAGIPTGLILILALLLGHRVKASHNLDPGQMAGYIRSVRKTNLL